MPFAYTLILQRTVYLFCSLLPLPRDRPALHDTVCFGVHFLYLLIRDSLAEELEDPFGVSANHLPLNAICNTIERNLLEMNDQSPLPPPMKPDEHFNLI